MKKTYVLSIVVVSVVLLIFPVAAAAGLISNGQLPFPVSLVFPEECPGDYPYEPPAGFPGDFFDCFGKKITIMRDNYGVPHVYAASKEGLAFGAGYAMAQDRLWQADLYRRQAFGSLAEFGFASINSDYNTRSLGYSYDELWEIFDSWNPVIPTAKLKEMTLAYVDGINLYISEALDALSHGDTSLIPIEYLPGVITPNGLPLRPFTVEDTVSIVVMMAWRFGGTGGNELAYASRYQALLDAYPEETAWDIFNDLYPQVDPGAPVTIPGSGCDPICTIPELPPFCDYPDNIIEIAEGASAVWDGQKDFFESMGLPTKFGSNAWIVSGDKSESGNPMEVGGPQMGHSIPQIVLEMGLHGAGLDVVGMMMPHAPSILIGASQYGAWTSTTGSSDLIDTYIEVLNPDNPHQYWFNGGWVDMEKRTERIYDYWSTGAFEDRDIYRTVHGPIIAWDIDNNLCFSVKSPYYKRELEAEEGWSLFQQAGNVWEFQHACTRVHASHNFYWVDRRGDIGYWHCGQYPIKPVYGKDGRLIDDRFPLWGTGEEEWLGVTGAAEMPKCINPSQGYMANWNNKPQADWTYSEADWGAVHRVRRIQDLLDADPSVTFDDMNEINKDAGYNHISAMYFLEFLQDAANADPTIPAGVKDALNAWDHHYNDYVAPQYPASDATYDDPGLTIYDEWFGRVKDAVFDDDLPPGVGGSDSTLLHVFNGPAADLPMNYDFLNGEDRDDVIIDALKDALIELESDFGTADVSQWLTPVRTQGFSSLGAYPSPRMHAMNRGTYNHIVEMPVWVQYGSFFIPLGETKGVNVIPPGQSGFMYLDGATPVLSPHAYDQLPLYETWTYKPMLFDQEDVEDVAESTIIIYM